MDEALAVVNRVVHLHRLAAADPHVHELAAAQATVARAGWGEGEQLADGRWTQARELPLQARRRARRLFGRRSRRERNEELVHLERLRGAAGRARCSRCSARSWPCGPGRTSTPAATRWRRSSCARRSPRPSRSCAGRDARTWCCGWTSCEQLSDGVEGEAERVLEAARSGRPGEERPRPDAELLAHALGRLEAALRARQQRV